MVNDGLVFMGRIRMIFRELFKRYPYLVIILCTSVVFGGGLGIKTIRDCKKEVNVVEKSTGNAKAEKTEKDDTNKSNISDEEAQQLQANDKNDEVEDQMTSKEFISVDESFLQDSLFIGDSRTELLRLYTKWENVDFFDSVGMNAWIVRRKKLTTIGDTEQTLEQVLEAKSYNKVYLMLGVNGLGEGNPETFREQMKKTIDLILEKQPDTVIFLNAIMHVTDAVDQKGGYVNNTEIDKRNQAIRTLADQKQVVWIDLNQCFDYPQTGKLGDEYTTDGVHIKANYIGKWQEYLLDHGVKLNKTIEH